MSERVIPQGEGIEALPPPGDERREVLRERGDALAEAAEVKGNERGRIDPTKLKVDPEIAQHFNELNELEVSNPDPEYRYKWENAGFNGRFIKASTYQGWEVVQGDDLAGIEHRGVAADSTRRVGDTILMKIRVDRYLIVERNRRARQAAMQGAVESNLQEVRDKHGNLGIKIHLPGEIPERLQKSMMNRAHAQQLAGQQFEERLRTGRIPGMPAPGAG